MKKIILILVTILFFNSCAKKINPFDGYQQIKNKKSINILEEKKNAPKEILVNTDIKGKLTLNDSVLTYHDTILSNYQIFSVEIKPSKKYKIKVSSLCNCAGFKKYMFIPQVNPAKYYENISIKTDSVYYNYEKGPLTLNKIWKVQSDSITNNTKFEFLLYSDNRNLSDKIYKFTSSSMVVSNNIAVPVIVPVNIKSTLIGDFYVIVEEY